MLQNIQSKPCFVKIMGSRVESQLANLVRSEVRGLGLRMRGRINV